MLLAERTCIEFSTTAVTLSTFTFYYIHKTFTSVVLDILFKSLLQVLLKRYVLLCDMRCISVGGYFRTSFKSSGRPTRRTVRVATTAVIRRDVERPVLTKASHYEGRLARWVDPQSGVNARFIIVLVSSGFRSRAAPPNICDSIFGLVRTQGDRKLPRQGGRNADCPENAVCVAKCGTLSSGTRSPPFSGY